VEGSNDSTLESERKKEGEETTSTIENKVIRGREINTETD